jgi:hypothetical protein
MSSRAFKLSLLLINLIAMGGCGLVVSGNDSEDFGAKQTYISRNADREIHFLIPDKDVPGYPSWRPGSPLPHAIERAIDIGTKELPKYSKGAQGWEFHGVSLTSLSTGPSTNDKWLYLVQFNRSGGSELLEIPIAMNGTPIQGVERPLNKRRWSN